MAAGFDGIAGSHAGGGPEHHIRPNTDPDSRQNRRTERGAFVGIESHAGTTKNIGNHLNPEIALRAAASDPNFTSGDAHASQEVEDTR